MFADCILSQINIKNTSQMNEWFTDLIWRVIENLQLYRNKNWVSLLCLWLKFTECLSGVIFRDFIVKWVFHIRFISFNAIIDRKVLRNRRKFYSCCRRSKANVWKFFAHVVDVFIEFFVFLQSWVVCSWLVRINFSHFHLRKKTVRIDFDDENFIWKKRCR